MSANHRWVQSNNWRSHTFPQATPILLSRGGFSSDYTVHSCHSEVRCLVNTSTPLCFLRIKTPCDLFQMQVSQGKDQCWERQHKTQKDKTGKDWREIITRRHHCFVSFTKAKDEAQLQSFISCSRTSQYEQLVAHRVKAGLPKLSATIPADWGTASEHGPECTWFWYGQWESVVWSLRPSV